MIIGWDGMGARERAFAIWFAHQCGLRPRDGGMNRARFDVSQDTLGFVTPIGTGPLVTTRVLRIDLDELAGKLDMTRAQLDAWIVYGYSKPDAVAPEDVARTIAEADALWDALDEC